MPDENQIRQMVRRVVYRTLGLSQDARAVSSRPLVTEADVHAIPVGGQLSVPQGALVTPLAQQVAMERQVTLVGTAAEDSGSTCTGARQQATRWRSPVASLLGPGFAARLSFGDRSPPADGGGCSGCPCWGAALGSSGGAGHSPGRAGGYGPAGDPGGGNRGRCRGDAGAGHHTAQ